MAVREIQAHLEEMYAAEVSPSLISSVTSLDKAVNYILKRWSALARVADDGRCYRPGTPVGQMTRVEISRGARLYCIYL